MSSGRKKPKTDTIPKKQGETAKMAAKGKSAFELPNQIDNLIRYFQTADKTDEDWFKILNLLPFQAEVFAPDGTMVFMNRAVLELTGINDTSLRVGNYNLLNDPVCNDQLGMREGIQKAFHGEPCSFLNSPVPIGDLIDRHLIDKKPFEKATMDYFLYPVRKDDKLHLVVFVGIVRNLYMGRPEVVRAKEYIDTHWQVDYDPHVVAKSVDMSVAQLYNLFKQHIGMTPGDYAKKVKVEHIKEKLADTGLSIKEVFASCGEDSRGGMIRVFKEMTGMSPTEYRKQVN